MSVKLLEYSSFPLEDCEINRQVVRLPQGQNIMVGHDRMTSTDTINQKGEDGSHTAVTGK